jgi:hypothetical protein
MTTATTTATSPTTDEQFETMKAFIADRVKRLKAAFPEYKFEGWKIGAHKIGAKQCGPMWGSIFIIRPDGVSIGRLLFADYNGKGPVYSHIKDYSGDEILKAMWQIV